MGWIYEANLIMDGRKDYEPSVNHGKRKFCASSARINVFNPAELLDWINNCYMPWQEQLYRCALPHGTLAEWVSSRTDMLVKCSNLECCSPFMVLPEKKLSEYLSSGLDLGALRSKLTCSFCRRREPDVFPF